MLQDQLRAKINNDLNDFVTEATTDGTETVVQDILERLANKHSSVDYYFVADQTGKVIAGNLTKVEIRTGLQKITISPDNDIGTAAPDEDHEVWGQGQKVPDGSFIFVGQDAFRMLSAQESMISSFLWFSSLAIFLAIAAGLFLSRRFLSRIDDINNTSQLIVDGKLTSRMPLRGTNDEFDMLSANLNSLLDSNHNLLESLKAVSTNIAHDLRTPLSRLRQRLETAKSSAKTKQELAAAIDLAVEESDQLLATFAALLRIAQIESGTRRAGFKQVDLSKVLERIAAAYQAVAEDQQKLLVTSWPAGCIITGDEELLLQMTVNLLENAIRHTSAGTQIGLKLVETQTDVCITVSDSGHGIPIDHREKVLEHFYRLDASRTTEGNGLGLALVSAIAKLHGSQVVLDDNLPGLKASVSLKRL